MTNKRSPRSAAPPPARKRRVPEQPPSFPIVGVGASAGGLEAFTELLRHLPLDTGMAFVLVQHLDPQHESALTQLLSRATALPVQDVTNNLRVEANRVYVIPRNTNLAIAHGVLKLQPRPKTRSPHRSIDFFFESLAQDQREGAIGVILSGTATDGTLGMEAIKAEGGITFTQDESARYDSMPKSAQAAGCVDFVLSPADIAREIARIAKHPSVAGGPEKLLVPEDDRALATAPEDGYKKILLLLRNHCGVDFTLYKSTTMQRRIARRMVLEKQNTLDDYARFLRGNIKELNALFSDVLISVTSFFRNPEAFDVLERKIFPKLLQQRGDEPLRVWVLGCSTGQEAYSIAMAFAESAEKVSRARKLQVFATDLNDALLDKARHGLYARTLVHDVTPERLRKFFVEEEGGYRIVKQLREIVVFARQNLVADPPFSRMDLISCRNLLIYLEPSLQKKALPTFHYALKPGGYLFLGASESVGGFADLFEPADKKHRIYSRKAAPTPAFHLPVKERGEQPWSGRSPPPLLPTGRPGVPEEVRGEPNAQREADRVIADQFAPASVLVDGDLQVVQFRGSTGAYLEAPTGKPSFDVLKMARAGLMLPLRATINKAMKDNKSARKENVRMNQNGETRGVNVEVIPLKNLRERCYLILFEDAVGSLPLAKAKAPRGVRTGTRSATKHESGRVAELLTELSDTREYLQSIQEQHEAANEELQAANEEVQSANEELQSINEELETSKEELESTNEELTTVNEEMANRNAELNRLNSALKRSEQAIVAARDYAEAIVRTARDPLLVLNADLRVHTVNEAFYATFKVSPAQSTGRLIYDLGNGQWNIPRLRHLLEEILPQHSFFNDVEVTQDFESIGRRTMLLNARTLSDAAGAPVRILLGIQDITERRQSEEALHYAGERFRFMAESMPQKIFTAKPDGEVDYLNPRWTEYAGLGFEEIREWGWKRVIHPDDLAENIRIWQQSLATGEPFLIEHRLRRADGEYRWHDSRALAFKDTAGEIQMWVGSNTDIHEVKEADRRKDEFLAMLAHELRGPLAPLTNMLEIIRRADGNKEQVQQARDTMERQVRQMTRLIDDLLDVSRISRGKLSLCREPVELASIVRQAIEACRPAIDAAGHELTVTLPSQPVYLRADAMRLAQVFGNLLNNASKFSESRGHISVTVEQQGGDVTISVKDDGIGIPPDMLPGIFELFTQLDRSLERAQGGLGIGLTLVRQLVQMHGGSVQGRSDGQGRGSEFVVHLPALVGKPPLPVRETGGGEVTAATGRRILIVDDNRDSADSLAMVLTMTGHETRTAHDGLEAVAAASSFRPDLVLLDIGLPKLNGYDAARRIREEPWGKGIVLVALTGWGQDEDRKKSRDAGFDHHLVKPVDYGTLTKLLGELPPVRASS